MIRTTSEQIIKFISKDLSRRHQVHKEHGGKINTKALFFLRVLCVLCAFVRNIGS